MVLLSRQAHLCFLLCFGRAPIEDVIDLVQRKAPKLQVLAVHLLKVNRIHRDVDIFISNFYLEARLSVTELPLGFFPDELTEAPTDLN